MKIQLTRNLGMLLLGIWLIISGLASFGFSFPGLGPLLGLLGIIAGVLILVGR
jgi:hypothetical protein